MSPRRGFGLRQHSRVFFLVIAKGRNKYYPADLAVERCLRAIKENKVKTINGKDMDVGCETICVHSDTPNAIEILKELRKNLSKSTTKQSNNINTNDNKLPYIVSE